MIAITPAHTVMATAFRLREVASLELELAVGDTDVEVEVEPLDDKWESLAGDGTV
jgi:hypothetical protein